MIYFKSTHNKRRTLTALLLGLLAFAFFILYPGAFTGSLSGLPGPAAYALPLLVALTLCCLLLDVDEGPVWVCITIQVLLILLCLFALLCASEIAGSGELALLLRYGSSPSLFALMFLFAFVGLLFALTGNGTWSLRIVALLATVYSITNYFVLQFRGTPFIPLDIFGAGTALNVIEGYTFSFSQALGEVLLVFLCVFFIASKTRLSLPKKTLRWSARGVSAVLAVALILPNMNSDYFDLHGYKPDFWDQKVTAVRNGSIVNFLANITYSLTEPPEGYSQLAAADIAAQYPSEAARDASVKPDVILILGESWADVTPEGIVETNIPYMPFLSSFRDREDGVYKGLVASTYGGGTSTSEFQILTGASTAFGMHTAPFQYNVRSYIPNLASQFKQLGYDTVALHNGEKSAWERDRAFPLMRFDEYLDQSDFGTPESKMVRHYLADEVMYDKMLQILEEVDEPQFMYALTIQAHGGYTTASYQSPVKITSPQGDYVATEQFLGLMLESDKALEAFINKLAERERPTIVLAFGDHKPAIDNDLMAYVRQQKGEDYGTWLYETFYVVWANYDLPQGIASSPDMISMNYLGDQLIQAAGLPRTGYQQFLDSGMQKYPVLSANDYMDASGNRVKQNVIEGTKIYQEQAIMQYNLLYDRDNIPSDFFALREAE